MPRLKFIVVGALILGAISYLMFSGISDSMVYYYTVSEALDMEQELSQSRNSRQWLCPGWKYSKGQ